MYWKELSKKEIKRRVFKALNSNINYDQETLIGVPASYLDRMHFYTDLPILKEAPYLLTMINNPNHIGCHTLTKDKSEEYFQGTQQLEIELIELLATQVFKAQPDSTDGYIAPGGTEANIQAQWIYRNYFQEKHGALPHEIGVLYTEDAHYSMPKGANLLGLPAIVIKTKAEDHKIDLEDLRIQLTRAAEKGIKYLAVTLNMATTIFGSVDEIDPVDSILNEFLFEYKIHIDAAFGGFIYPFTNPNNTLNFAHPSVNSITIDGHKMLQAPYGTGIFLIRKGWMNYTTSNAAKYVSGLDSTLCGSRSGANAIAMWMILKGYGSEGWTNYCNELIARTDHLCKALDDLGLLYCREKHMNIVTISAENFPVHLADKFHLVGDDKENPSWYKVVVMPHVTLEILDRFINKLRLEVWVNE
ncbi:MAG: aspartate aminotransferase family protein [Crocinitomicaceae bacterium]|nr:aspartate aminotransferase family protein [Crocinitomicaceae bacterium]|tara:strand:- start:22026 stop:23270 length:1245 start_codon:yes stop_codon:yes gene_type:complete